jgi:hypothetical protein
MSYGSRVNRKRVIGNKPQKTNHRKQGEFMPQYMTSARTESRPSSQSASRTPLTSQGTDIGDARRAQVNCGLRSTSRGVS